MSKNVDLQELLSQQVKIFEESDHDLADCPQQLIDSYGYACLSNALMNKDPVYPKYNKDISEIFKKKKFNTLESLISFIRTYKEDMDKLFAIFCWAALNIEYDVHQLLSGEHKSTSLEDVFVTKKAVCAGYALFYTEMAKKVSINQSRIVIKEYSNFSKAFGFDPLNPPKTIKSDHASVHITIDGVPYISEPTWAAGHITDSKEFEWSFRPELFLIPLYKSLCDHFPCDDSTKLLPFKYTFPQFFQSCKIYPFGRCLKTESQPLVNFSSSTGYVEQFYNCNGPIEFISFKIYVQKKVKKSTVFSQIDQNGITSYQVVKPKLHRHPDKARFRTCISFPKEGFYKVDLYIDGPNELTYFVKALKKSSGSVRCILNPFHESRFIPISPKTVSSVVTGGYAIIRFAVVPKKSNLLWNIVKLKKNDSFETDGETIDRKYGNFIKLQIPFDDERYEDQLGVTFPSNGRYCVSVFLQNEEQMNNYSLYTRYYFTVSGVTTADPTPVSPVNYLYKGRTFAPSKIYDNNGNQIEVLPDQSCFVVDKTEQTIQFKPPQPTDNLSFEFRKVDDTVVDRPIEDGQNGQFKKFKFTIPNEDGEYHLYGWLNGNYCIDIPYFFFGNTALNEPSDQEKELLNELKSLTDQDESKLLRKQREEEERLRKQKEEQNKKNQKNNEQKASKDTETSNGNVKKQSKCCLLI